MATNNGDIEIEVEENFSGVSQQYVDAQIAKEAQARQEADNALQTEYKELVKAEAETREAEDNKLSDRINENKTAIQANKENLETEVQTRTSENVRIEAVVEANRQQCQSNFNTVNKTIENKDKECKDRVNAVSSKVDKKEAESIARLEAEKKARQESEQLIMSYVDSKSAGALHYRGSVATVDYLPQVGQQVGDMYNVEEDGQNYAWTGFKWDSQGPLINLKPLEQGIADNATAIQNEVTNRQAANNTLQANINKEVTDRQSACNTLQTNITNEETRAKGAEGTLQSNITKEETRAKAAEKTLQTNIDTEASNRQTSESTLKTELLAEISKKTSAEIAQDFEQTKAKINAVADLTDTGGFWVFAITDSAGNVTFGQTINGDIINGI